MSHTVSDVLLHLLFLGQTDVRDTIIMKLSFSVWKAIECYPLIENSKPGYGIFGKELDDVKMLAPLT